MAQRRMFSMKIVDTDAFLEMPQSSQLLYFHLAMRADDDGFVAGPKRIMRMIGSQDDDIKVLIGKRFIIPFESGVCVIKHWRIHNLIREDRYTETTYLAEKSTLAIKENGAYTELNKKNSLQILRPISKIEKSKWQINRQKVRKESNLPDSFDYKIRQAFIGKKCPICKNEMRKLSIEESNYLTKSSPMPSIQHIIPISKGGKHELKNIAVICHSCNVSIRNDETGELNSKEVIEVWNTIGNQSATSRRLG